MNTFGLKSILLIIYASLNIYAFIIYGTDKKRAVILSAEERRPSSRKGKREKLMRIPEKTLITAAVFGVIGAAAGMVFFHHKTRKPKFYIGIPLIFAAEAAAAVFAYIILV